MERKNLSASSSVNNEKCGSRQSTSASSTATASASAAPRKSPSLFLLKRPHVSSQVAISPSARAETRSSEPQMRAQEHSRKMLESRECARRERR
eukprot:39933-Pleurochrysis_carterae.AAC.1